MKKRKLVASALALSMGATMLSACSSSDKKDSSKTGNEVTVIDEVTDDIAWYTISETTVGEEFSAPEYESVYTNMLATTDTGFVVNTVAQRPIPENIDWDNFVYADYVDDYISFYNFEGELVNRINLNDTLDQVGENFSVDTADYVNGALLITGSEYDPDTYMITYYNMTLDPEHDTTGEWGPSTGNGDGPVEHFIDEGYSEGFMYVGDYVIEKLYCYDQEPISYVLYVTSPDGEETMLDLREIFPGMTIWDISTAIPIDENTALLAASGDRSGDTYFELDLNSMEITDATDDYSWIGTAGLYNIKNIEGRGSYSVDFYGVNPGVTRLDFENQTSELVLGTNNANINPEKYSNMQVAYVDDDSIVLAGDVYEQSMGNMSNSSFRIVTFTRADSNPNVGKEVIKVATLSSLDYAVYESICQFNESSDSVYVTVDRRYSANNLDYSDIETYEDYLSVYNEGMSNIADQLTVDIIAGDGPDILFDANALTQLNNADYLVDLSDLVVDNGDYFTNVFDACKTNGALYQMPLSIAVQAIITTREYVSDDQIGFTYDEFVDFVNGPCNGSNPLYYDNQVTALTELAGTMSDVFMEGNGVNYDNDAFRALAAYVNDNINDTYDDGTGYYGTSIEWEEDYEAPVASADGLYNMYTFLSNYGSKINDVRVLGLPSYDGRGPQFNVLTSVAVSAQSSNIDACKEYVSYLLGDEIQTLLANNSWANPVNRSVILNNAEQVIDDFNTEVDMYAEWYTQDELVMYGLPSAHVSYDVVDDYLAIIDGCTNCTQTDIAINMIISEEIQAYFAGQKSIDQVIDTMTNRINTYLNERG